MRIIFLALLLFLPASAQLHPALWMDLSGEWRIAYGDRPEYAAADFDDREWKTLALPLGESHLLQQHWLRRRVELPEGTDRTQLALTLGTIQDVYEVYVNGQRIGASSNWNSHEDTQIPRPRTFFLPPEVIAGTRQMQIALRIQYVFYMVPTWILPDQGPYALSYRFNAPLDAGQHQAEKRWFAYLPGLMISVAVLVMGMVGLVAWRSEPSRYELFWFGLIGLQAFASYSYIMIYLRSSFHPFNRLGQAPLQGLLDLVQNPLLGMLVLSVLRIRSRWLHAAIWLAWGVMPLSFLVDAAKSGTRLGNLTCSALILTIVLVDWRRLRGAHSSRQEHLLRFLLLLPALSDTVFWGRLIVWNDIGSGVLRTGPFLIWRDQIFLLCLFATILTLLLRRVADDRRDQQRLAGELNAARSVQQMLLSHSKAGGESPIDAVYAPAQEVGGDFYQVLPRDEGGYLVLVGDVSGKGLNAAMLVSVVIGASRRDSQVTPAAMLAGLNTALAGYTAGGFVTCCCALLQQDGRLTVANAGHLPPYWNGEEVAVESGLALGLVREVSYSETTIHLAAGDQVTLLSDGVVEATNAKGELFGFDRTREISAGTAAEIAAAAEAWGQNDDITVVTIRRAK